MSENKWVITLVRAGLPPLYLRWREAETWYTSKGEKRERSSGPSLGAAPYFFESEGVADAVLTACRAVGEMPDLLNDCMVVAVEQLSLGDPLFARQEYDNFEDPTQKTIAT